MSILRLLTLQLNSNSMFWIDLVCIGMCVCVCVCPSPVVLLCDSVELYGYGNVKGVTMFWKLCWEVSLVKSWFVFLQIWRWFKYTSVDVVEWFLWWKYAHYGNSSQIHKNKLCRNWQNSKGRPFRKDLKIGGHWSIRESKKLSSGREF